MDKFPRRDFTRKGHYALEALLVGFLLLQLFADHATGDSWGPVRSSKTYSVKSKCTLTIQPHRNWVEYPGHCRATLVKSGATVWSRYLINNAGPGSAYVADSGEYVITMDEYARVGVLPVVIYGRKGELLHAHSLESLELLRDDTLGHIRMSVSSTWWSENAISFFGPEDREFLIRLHWGKWIVIDLPSAKLLKKDEIFFREELRLEHLRRWAGIEAFRQKGLREVVLKMIQSENDYDKRTATMVCGQEKFAEMIPNLRKLLRSKAFWTEGPANNQNVVLFVRREAKQALEAMGESVGNVACEFPASSIRYDKKRGEYVFEEGQ